MSSTASCLLYSRCWNGIWPVSTTVQVVADSAVGQNRKPLGHIMGGLTFGEQTGYFYSWSESRLIRLIDLNSL